MIPEFAILGHPNEGKSSVLSTLTEDDSVRISSLPGETKVCRIFPVIIDQQEIIRFTDTPGFQNPHRLLHDFQQLDQPTIADFNNYVKKNSNDPELKDDCELLKPLLRGAGIIYVADGSRPVRNVDLAEMEILRLTGKPRMAILNSKEDKTEHLEAWKTEFRKHFNSARVFNAHSATYLERITLLEALKSIEQDWQKPLEYVVEIFKKDWQQRNIRAAELILEMIHRCMAHSCSATLAENSDTDAAKKKLYQRYTADIKKFEKNHHDKIRKLYKHNIFDYSLPEQSLLHSDLFSRQTWEFLGLSQKQLMIVGGAGGAMVAAGLDLAAGGASLGLFTSLGGVLGAMGALYGGKSFAEKTKILGLGGGRIKLTVGPVKNSQFGFILLDRAFLYYSHIINWAHGRRDYANSSITESNSSFTRKLDKAIIRSLSNYFSKLSSESDIPAETIVSSQQLVAEQLQRICHNDLANETDNQR